MDDILVKESLSALLEEAKDEGLFNNCDDLADYLIEHGVTIDEDLV